MRTTVLLAISMVSLLFAMAVKNVDKVMMYIGVYTWMTSAGLCIVSAIWDERRKH